MILGLSFYLFLNNLFHPPSFPELELKIKETVESLGGSVFPKLSRSAPKDLAWISTAGPIQCTTFSEITLLLRVSDSLIHDLCHAYDSCTDKVIVKTPEFLLCTPQVVSIPSTGDGNPLFCMGSNLVGTSQRNVTTFYPVLLEKKSDIEWLIRQFYEDHVRLKFESENYTFDVYVTMDERIKVLDFNPWGAFSLPLLFNWEELRAEHQGRRRHKWTLELWRASVLLGQL